MAQTSIHALRSCVSIFFLSGFLAACGGGGGTSNNTSALASTPANPTNPSGGESTATAPVNDQTRALAARFSEPYGIAADASGNLYVADSGNFTIRKITPAGDVTTVAGTSGQFLTSEDAVGANGDGNGATARFSILRGITTDAAGNVFVGDTRGWAGRIRRVTPDGTVSTFVDGPYVLGLTIDNAGNLYAAGNGRGSPIGLFRITPGGAVTSLANDRSRAVAFNNNTGTLYFAETGIDYPSPGQVSFGPSTCAIRSLNGSGETATVAGRVAASGEDTCGYADGQGEAARFAGSNGMAIDAQGNLYIADTGNHVIRRVTPSGETTTIAGLAGNRGSADGSGGLARFNAPSGITIDRTGNLYIADTGNHTIRRMTAGGVVTTIAGAAGQSGSTDVPPEDNPL